jgi:hypothetical protein
MVSSKYIVPSFVITGENRSALIWPDLLLHRKAMINKCIELSHSHFPIDIPCIAKHGILAVTCPTIAVKTRKKSSHNGE